MSQNTYKKPSLDDYDEGVREMLNRVEVGAIELSDFIEDMLSKAPLDKINARGWKKQINALIDEYNSRFGKIYKRI